MNVPLWCMHARLTRERHRTRRVAWVGGVSVACLARPHRHLLRAPRHALPLVGPPRLRRRPCSRGGTLRPRVGDSFPPCPLPLLPPPDQRPPAFPAATPTLSRSSSLGVSKCPSLRAAAGAKPAVGLLLLRAPHLGRRPEPAHTLCRRRGCTARGMRGHAPSPGAGAKSARRRPRRREERSSRRRATPPPAPTRPPSGGGAADFAISVARRRQHGGRSWYARRRGACPRCRCS